MEYKKDDEKNCGVKKPVGNIKILVADDEPNILEVMKLYLEKEGYTVYTAPDGQTAFDIEEKHRPDLLILDIMLPKYSGLEICESIKRQVAVIFITAKSAETDKLAGFSLGADDYITKPFSPKEAVARVKAVLRRSGHILEVGTKFEFPGLIIDPLAQTVLAGNRDIPLSPKEFELLLFFAKHPKIPFSREQLLTNIWGYDFDGDDRTVDATIKRLRQKIDNSAFHYIHTVWKVGYKFETVSKSGESGEK